MKEKTVTVNESNYIKLYVALTRYLNCYNIPIYVPYVLTTLSKRKETRLKYTYKNEEGGIYIASMNKTINSER